MKTWERLVHPKEMLLKLLSRLRFMPIISEKQSGKLDAKRI